MALYQDLPVFADIYSLTHKVFLFTQDYPREYKFTLGQDMKRDCLVLLRSIYRINKSTDKVAHLEAFLDDFELLKLEIRLSGDLKILPTKKHSELIVLMDSIGKQIRFVVDFYWSSSEYGLGAAWNQNFYNGTQYVDSGTSSTHKSVRPVRAF